MENNSWLFVVLIILSVWFWRDHRDLRNQLEETRDELYAYQYALGQANSNIEEAQWYAWESYNDMGDALDNLETVRP